MADLPQLPYQQIIIGPAGVGGGLLTTTMWVAIAAVVAACIAAWISRSIKVSEFRQEWINDLRKDIADYVGLAERWVRKYEEINDINPNDPRREVKERDELFPIANETSVVLRRIRMRFNPRPNRHKIEDDDFLQSLADLLNPGKLTPQQSYASWSVLASSAVEMAREILKREWEVTKRLPPRWLWDRLSGTNLQ
jgi:hypothetical protein